MAHNNSEAKAEEQRKRLCNLFRINSMIPLVTEASNSEIREDS